MIHAWPTRRYKDRNKQFFYVDDLKSSHKMKLVNDRFKRWLNQKYGKHSKVTATRGKVHDYLGMELDYSKQGELKINMTKYVENMFKDFPVQLGKKDVAKTPAGDNLFNLGTGAKLDMKRLEIFHTFVAKGLFLCKRARPDILGIMHKSQGSEPSGLGETHESYEIFERDEE
jgi:hypothetical protein